MMIKQTFNVIAMIKHKARGKAQPVIEPRRLWLSGFSTREEAERFARLAIEQNKGVVLKAWVEQTPTKEKGANDV